MDIGLSLLRVVVGALFIGHGTQKLFGWFGGHGPQGTGGFLSSLGYRPGLRFAYLGGLAEAGGGSLLLLGLLTPLGSVALIGMMVSATFAVHWKNGVWNPEGGFELPLTYATVAAMYAFVGPGRYSIDAAIGWNLSGALWGIGAIVVGAASAAVMLAWRSVQLRQQQAAHAPASREEAA